MMSFSSVLILICLTFAGINITIEAHIYDKELTLSLNESELSFLIIGDWGSDKSKQHKVGSAMGKWCEENDCEFVLALGDNFYSTGVYSNDSERFQTTWSDVYNHYGIATLNWYVIVGNHDHGNGIEHEDGHEWFQVEHSQIDPRWVAPDLAYSLTVDIEDTKIKFVNIDTESIRNDVNDPNEMLVFMNDQLNETNIDWKIVCGHHPVYTATGNYEAGDPIREKVLPIMQNYGTHIYLAGHEHNQQHYQNASRPNDMDHIITGAGGQHLSPYSEDTFQKSAKDGGNMLKCDIDYGFIYMTINFDAISWKFVNSNLKVVYEYTRQRV